MTLTLLSQRLEREYELDGKRYQVLVIDDTIGVYRNGRVVRLGDVPQPILDAAIEWAESPGMSRCAREIATQRANDTVST